MNAVLLAAGLGKRMKPITDHIPKPLLPIVDFRLIDYNIDRLLEFGINRVCINLFHKADMIEKYLDKYSGKITVAKERILKGTGGALLNFRDIIRGDFIFYSCDALTDIDITAVIKFHQTRRPAATLVLLEQGNAKIVHIDDEQKVRDITNLPDENAYDFAGIAVFSERIFSYLPKKDSFSIVEVWKTMLENNEFILGFPETVNWYNINSPQTYWQVHYDLLVGDTAIGKHHFGSSFYVDPTSEVRAKNISGFISIGPNCSISENVSLTNTVVLGNSVIKQGHYTDCLLSDMFCIEINN